MSKTDKKALNAVFAQLGSGWGDAERLIEAYEAAKSTTDSEQVGVNMEFGIVDCRGTHQRNIPPARVMLSWGVGEKMTIPNPKINDSNDEVTK